jgi:hypothetical protein
VATPPDDDARPPSRAKNCASCGTRLGEDQKYCLECGARRGPLPAAIASQLAPLLERQRSGDAPAAEPKPEPKEEQKTMLGFMPNPRAAAVAVMGMLAFGVLLGSAISPLAQSAGLYSILLEEEPEQAPSEPEEPIAEAESEPEIEETPLAEASTAIPPKSRRSRDRTGTETRTAAGRTAPRRTPRRETPVPDRAGGKRLRRKLRQRRKLALPLPNPGEEGEVLSNYFAVAGSDLANQIALISARDRPRNRRRLSQLRRCHAGDRIGLRPGRRQRLRLSRHDQEPARSDGGKETEVEGLLEDIGNDPSQATTCRHPPSGRRPPPVLTARRSPRRRYPATAT